MINYAHRGFSELYPENTLFSFYMALTTGADGIETDIQRTRDGVLVLFHDDSLQRILGFEGKIRDFTLEELRGFDFGRFKGPAFAGEPIVTLEEFLQHFAARDLAFALEIKQPGVEKELLEMIRRFGIESKVTITSFSLESLAEVRRLDADIRIGWLVREVSEAVFQSLLTYRIQQICPRIDQFSPEQFARARELGLSIRFWGVSTPEKMHRAIAAGGDGMTVNDPRLLSRALGRR